MNAKPCLRLLLLAAPAAWVACATATGRPAGPPASWKQVMVDHVGPNFDVIAEEAALADEDVDLARVAATAEVTAGMLALGQGDLGLKEVRGFTDYARKAEDWMATIAAAARAGDVRRVKDLVRRDGEYCDACHSAAADDD